MPVSKKRKKDGAPVQRKAQPAPAGAEHESHPDSRPAPESKHGKARNPFVAQSIPKRGAQRGR
jgi:hypothetical protein